MEHSSWLPTPPLSVPPPTLPVLGKDKQSGANLDHREKRAAEALGYDAHAWDQGCEPESCKRPWKMLSQEEQRSALMLGYVEQESTPGQVAHTL